MPRPQLQASRAGGAAFSDEPAGKILDLSRPYDGLPKGGLAALLVGNKRKYAEIAGEEDEEERKKVERTVRGVEAQGGTAVVQLTGEGLVPATAAAKAVESVPEVLRPAVVNPALAVSQVRLAVPMVRSVILRPLDSSKSVEALGSSHVDDAAVEGGEDLIFEARNACLLYTSPSPRDGLLSRMPSSA